MTTSQTKTAKEFLDAIHGENALIYFNVGHLTWKYKPQTYSEAEPKLKWLNGQGKDIYFIVNTGGTTDNSIIRINGSFIDWDCGKDEKGNYFAIDIVKQKKAVFLTKFQECVLIPTFIVETRNGYQIYWLLYPGTTNDQFIELQLRLAYYFKSDITIHNPARVMRLPGYNWVKPTKHCEPYFVEIFSYNPVRYNSSQLFDFFSIDSQTDYEIYIGKTTEKKNNGTGTKGAQINTLLKNKYNKDNTCGIYLGSFLQSKQESPLLSSHIVDYLKKQDLIEYMNKEYKTEYTEEQTHENPVIVKCPIHDDETPSASILIDKETGYQKLCCHSSNCGFRGSIIDIVMKKEEMSMSRAVTLLIKQFNITEDDSWKAEHKEMISRNIKIIENLFELKEKYPNLYRVIHRVKKDLLSKLVYAQENLKLRTSSNHNVIIASLSKWHHLASGLKEDGRIGRQDERIDRYCFLGLMRKLHDDEIPASIRANAYGTRDKTASRFKNKGKSINMKRTQCYSIPEFTPELLEKADVEARTLKERGIRLKAISRDMVLKTFSIEKAQELYPLIRTDKISESGEAFMAQVETILLERLDSKGFCSVGYIIEVLQKKYNWKYVTDKRVKKYIPALFTKHNLEEITANKELKQKFKIESKGYPKLIIKKVVVEQRKSYGAVVRSVDVVLVGLLGKKVCGREGSMFRRVGSMDPQFIGFFGSAA